MKSIFLSIMMVLAAGAAAFCAPQETGAVQPEATVAPADAGMAVWRGESYRLRPKDVVRISVFQEEDLETVAKVGTDGNISFPLIISARIGGKTIPEATEIVESLLKEYYIKPQVTISITEYAKRYFTILGQISKPGTFDMPEDNSLNLVEAVGMAGGYTRIANPSKITVKRLVNGRETVLKIDGKKMLVDGSARFEVEPGDTIVVAESIW